jgi:hypothetical protein
VSDAQPSHLTAHARGRRDPTTADTASATTVEETRVTFRTRLVIKGHTDKNEAKIDVAKGLASLAWDVSKGRASPAPSRHSFSRLASIAPGP